MQNAIQKTLLEIHEICADISPRLMEVCGTHTMAIHQHGLRSLLPSQLELVSGPGCPVCVTPVSFIDKIIELSKRENNVICTFGDLVRVPGSHSSLENEKAQGQDIRIVYSPADALKMAVQNSKKNHIFIGIGFETTAPAVAVVIEKASQMGMENFSIACAHKTMPNALEQLAQDPNNRINGFICPGHVSAVIGTHPYEFLPAEYGVACAVAGFEPLDILTAIKMLCRQIQANALLVELEYERVVKPGGNLRAMSIMKQVFRECDSEWRGLGIIPESGLEIRPEYQHYDALVRTRIEIKEAGSSSDCICGDILRGLKKPVQCKLFGEECTPESPIGACMVSGEGTCAAFYKYSDSRQYRKPSSESFVPG